MTAWSSCRGEALIVGDNQMAKKMADFSIFLFLIGRNNSPRSKL